MGGLAEKVKAVNEATRNNGLDRFAASLKSVGENATRVGQSLTVGVTAPLVAISTLSLKAAIDFESSFAGVRKTVNASTAELEDMRQELRDLAKEIPAVGGVNGLNRIAESAGQLGIQKENIVGFTRVVAELAATTNLAGEQGATMLARFANVAGVDQSERGYRELGNVIVALGNAGASTESEILEMGLRIAGAGRQVGLTAPQILGLANALSSMGLEAEGGGTAVSHVLIDMASAVASGSSKIAELSARVGISVDQWDVFADAVRNATVTELKPLAEKLGVSTKELRTMVAAADEAGGKLALFAKVAGVTGAEFEAAFKEDAAGALATFIEGLGRMSDEGENVFDVLEELGLSEIRVRDALLRSSNASDVFTKSMEVQNEAVEEADALAEEFGKRQATTASQMEVMQQRANDVAITLGDALVPFLLAALNVADPLIQKAAELAKGFAGLDTSTQGFIVVAGLLAASIGPALVIFGQLASSLGALITLFRALQGLQILAAAPALFNPITLALAAIVAAIILLKVAWENNWGDIQGVTANALGILSQILPSMAEVITGVVRTIGSAFSLLGKALLDNIGNLPGPMQDAARGIADAMQFIGDKLTAGADIADTQMKNVAKSAAQLATDLRRSNAEIGDLLAEVEVDFTELGELTEGSMERVRAAVGDSRINEAVVRLEGVFASMQDQTSADMEEMAATVEENLNDLPDMVSANLEPLEGIVAQSMGLAIKANADAWDDFPEPIDTASADVVKIVGEMGTNVTEEITKSQGPTGAQAQLLGTNITTGVSTGIEQGQPNVFETIRNLATGALAAAAAVLSPAATAAAIGVPLVMGIVAGMNQAKPALAAAANDTADVLIGEMESALEISSPSGVALRRLGIPVGEGIAKGVRAGLRAHRREAIDGITGFMNELVSQFANYRSEFGEQGQRLASALMQTLRENTGQNGAQVGRELDKIVDEMRRAGIENWRQLGDDLAGAFSTALIDRSDESRDAAIAFLDATLDEIDEARMRKAIRDALDGMLDEFGVDRRDKFSVAMRNLLSGAENAIDEETPKSVEAVGKLASAMLQEIRTKVSPADFARIFNVVMSAVEDVIKERTPGALAEFRALMNGLRGEVEQLSQERILTQFFETMAEQSEVASAGGSLARAGRTVMQALGAAVREQNEQTLADLTRASGRYKEVIRTLFNTEEAERRIAAFDAAVREDLLSAAGTVIEETTRINTGLQSTGAAAEEAADRIKGAGDIIKQVESPLSDMADAAEEAEESLIDMAEAVEQLDVVAPTVAIRGLGEKITVAQAATDELTESAGKLDTTLKEIKKSADAAKDAVSDFGQANAGTTIPGAPAGTSNTAANLAGTAGRQGIAAANDFMDDYVRRLAARTNELEGIAKGISASFATWLRTGMISHENEITSGVINLALAASKAGVPAWREGAQAMADAAKAVFMATTPETKAAALASFNAVTQAYIEVTRSKQMENATEEMWDRIDKAQDKKDPVGGMRRIMTKMMATGTEIIQEKTPELINRVGELSAQFVALLAKDLSPEQMARVLSPYRVALEKWLLEPTQENLDAVNAAMVLGLTALAGVVRTSPVTKAIQDQMRDWEASFLPPAQAVMSAVHSLFLEGGDKAQKAIVDKFGPLPELLRKKLPPAAAREAGTDWFAALTEAMEVGGEAGYQILDKALSDLEKRFGISRDKLLKMLADTKAKVETFSNLSGIANPGVPGSSAGGSGSSGGGGSFLNSLGTNPDNPINFGPLLLAQLQGNAGAPWTPPSTFNSQLPPQQINQQATTWIFDATTGIWTWVGTGPAPIYSGSSPVSSNGPIIPSGAAPGATTSTQGAGVNLTMAFQQFDVILGAFKAFIVQTWPTLTDPLRELPAILGPLLAQWPPEIQQALFGPLTQFVNDFAAAAGNASAAVTQEQKGIIDRIVAGVSTMTDPLTQLPADLLEFTKMLPDSVRIPLLQFADKWARDNAPFLAALSQFSQNNLGFENAIIQLQSAMKGGLAQFNAVLSTMTPAMQSTVNGLMSWLSSVLPTLADPAKQLPGMLDIVLSAFPPELRAVLKAFLLDLADVLEGIGVPTQITRGPGAPELPGGFQELFNLIQAAGTGGAASFAAALGRLTGPLGDQMRTLANLVRNTPNSAGVMLQVQKAIASFTAEGKINEAIFAQLPADIAAILRLILPQLFAALTPVPTPPTGTPEAEKKLADVLSALTQFFSTTGFTGPNAGAAYLAMANLPASLRDMMSTLKGQLKDDPALMAVANQAINMIASGSSNTGLINALLAALPAELRQSVISIGNALRVLFDPIYQAQLAANAYLGAILANSTTASALLAALPPNLMPLFTTLVNGLANDPKRDAILTAITAAIKELVAGTFTAEDLKALLLLIPDAFDPVVQAIIDALTGTNATTPGGNGPPLPDRGNFNTTINTQSISLDFGGLSRWIVRVENAVQTEQFVLYNQLRQIENRLIEIMQRQANGQSLMQGGSMSLSETNRRLAERASVDSAGRQGGQTNVYVTNNNDFSNDTVIGVPGGVRIFADQIATMAETRIKEKLGTRLFTTGR